MTIDSDTTLSRIIQYRPILSPTADGGWNAWVYGYGDFEGKTLTETIDKLHAHVRSQSKARATKVGQPPTP